MKIEKQTVIGKLEGWADILGQFSSDLRSAKLELADGRTGDECTEAEDEALYAISDPALTACSQLRIIVERLKEDRLL